MKRALLTIAVVAIYVLHQDFWFWRRSEPLLLGILPPALWYHAIFTLVVVLLMWLLVRYAWPSELERDAEAEQSSREGDHR